MQAVSSFLTYAIAALLAVVGIVHLAAPRPLRRLLAEWGYGRGFNWVAGSVALVAAVFLAVPQLRIWGVVLSGFILFGTTIELLEHRKYLYAFSNILVLGVLPLALVAG